MAFQAGERSERQSRTESSVQLNEEVAHMHSSEAHDGLTSRALSARLDGIDERPATAKRELGVPPRR